MRERLSPDQISRRSLLRGALTGAVVVAGFQCAGLKEVVAAVLRVGRPAFSAQALQTMLDTASPSQRRLYLDQGSTDPKGFVRSHFVLTAAQDASLDHLSSQDLDALKNSIRAAEVHNMPLRFTCWSPQMRKAGGDPMMFQSTKILTTHPVNAPGAAMTIKLGQ